MKAKVLPDGLHAQVVNPYRMASYEWNLFNKANPPRQLMTDKPLPAGSIIEVEEIEQLHSPVVGWVNKSQIKDFTRFIRETRIIFKRLEPSYCVSPNPDVILFDAPKENPLWKWVHLSNWAIKNNDRYLQERAFAMILKLKNKII